MKNTIMITIVFTFSMLLAACSNAGTDSALEESSLDNTEQQEDDTADAVSDKGDETTEEEESSGVFELKVDDQLDLEIGDTGTIETTLGTYEMTLNSAKLLGAEFDGEETLLDELILLEITIKNLSENEINIEEIMESMGVSSDLDGSNSYDGAEDFDSIEKFVGILGAGEEKSGQFITDVYTAEEYYFKKDTGNITGGSSNQVIWTIKADDAR
ncbi:hypothetical protein [Paucisalibacillus sp. EB02]|uniref:hypothetical protein n=1 Tax=Paucisalibacillus sp. EB02 TaxID=1347087 RepID=UPI0005AB1E1C|nr:hypothetical protein [Paucisalibacillus sp. EB02]